jgi:broad specificity phosphatase PhoE
LSRHEVVLARHGRPRIGDVSPITGRELGVWLRHYDACGIDRDIPPPDALRQLAASAGRVLSSDLRRSIESASCLSGRAAIDPQLREAGLPDRIGIPIRLHPGICVALARVAWWLDWSTSAETVGEARQRADRATDRLCQLAYEHRSVLVVGHGMFNRFVAKCLRQRGWSGPRVLPREHWSFARFARNL